MSPNYEDQEKMQIQNCFATAVYQAKLLKPAAALNLDLIRECHIFSKIDPEGRRWSKKHYAGGYTSYASVNDLPERSPHFAEFRGLVDLHVKKFAKRLEWNLMKRRLVMNTCWINIMPPMTSHGSHIHPLSVISGTYYLETPKPSSPLQFEDPRLGLMMGTPPVKAKSRVENRRFIELHPQAGDLVLFESWLRHQVPAQPGQRERISISFNYDWV